MRAAVIERFGGPEELVVKDVPVPEIDDDEVLIAVHTAGVGAWDPDMRAGWSPSGRARFPLVLGSDCSGTVVAKGRRVRRLQIKDRVYANTFDNRKGGSYAQYVAVTADNVATVPVGMDLKQAGGLAVSGLTALEGLDGGLHLGRGESIAITGASGAVGTVAVQLAKVRGARVLAIASGRDGAGLARRLGAEVAIDGRSDDVAAAVERFAPKGLDAILALAAGEALDACMAALSSDGRVAYPNGVEPKPRKRGITVTAYNGESGTREFSALNRLAVKAHIKVPIGATFSLEEVQEAHRKVTEHVLGKVVLRIR
jgi:NADPH:quinone reductase-like Zn-dependent oxidoreductase